jgi:hypothetical protein
MSKVMRIVGIEGPHRDERSEAVVGKYLRSYDPEAHGGAGHVEVTAELEHAQRFPSLLEAMELWKAVPANNPVRLDGKPNRPLSAYSVEIMEVID